VTLNLGVCNREELLDQLAGNRTDLAVMVRPPLDMDTVNAAFAPHPYVIVAAPNHPLVGRKRVPVSRLAREHFVVREKGSDTWNSMQQGFGAHLAQLNIAMEIKSTETIKQAVMAGMGVSFLSAHTISRELQAGSLAVLDVQGFPLMLNWYVVHRKAKRLPPVAQAFRSFLLKDGAALIEQTIGFSPNRPQARK
jgi:DNA-binding transcriptional LysR family regulator